MSWNAVRLINSLQERNPWTGLKKVQICLIAHFTVSTASLYSPGELIQTSKTLASRFSCMSWIHLITSSDETPFSYRGGPVTVPRADCVTFWWSHVFLSCDEWRYDGRHVWVFLHRCGFHTYESLLRLHMTAELSHLACPVCKREAYPSLRWRWWDTHCKVIREVHYMASRMEKANFFVRVIFRELSGFNLVQAPCWV